MLKKLYKHEFYSLLRLIFPVYIGLVGLAVLSRLSFSIDSDNLFVNIFRIGVLLVYIFGIMAMFIISMVLTVIRFYKHLLSHEGYLTFSLPFKASQHINCKLICGVAVMLINSAVLLLSLTVFTIGTDFWKIVSEGVSHAVGELLDNAAVPKIILLAVELVLLLPISFAQGLLMYYTCMAIGQQFKNRIAAAVLAYICIYSALQIVGLFIMIPISVLSPQIFEVATADDGINVFLIYMTGVLALSLILGGVYYFVTRHLLTKKLNLE